MTVREPQNANKIEDKYKDDETGGDHKLVVGQAPCDATNYEDRCGGYVTGFADDTAGQSNPV